MSAKKAGLSDQQLAGLVVRLERLKLMSSEPSKVQRSIDTVALTLRLRT